MYGRFPAPVTRESGVGKSSQLIHLLHFDRAYHKCPEAEKTPRLHHKAEIGIYLESAGWGHSKKRWQKKEGKKKKKKTHQGDGCSSVAASASICPQAHFELCSAAAGNFAAATVAVI